MKKLFFIYLATIFTIITSCSEDTTVMIRVKNVSTFDYKHVIIGSDSIGNLGVGQYSNYKIYSSAYSYNSYHFIIDNDTIDMYAIDYVGEELLESGKYTYEINAVKNEDNSISASLQCIKD
mgnify:CR=1 FL=1|jgi:hypothetical protein